MSILNITYNDFGKGKFELHKGMYEQDKINDYIDRYEKQYLIELLGADLYTLFSNDLVAGVPVDPIYLSLYNEFMYDNSCHNIVVSEGMIVMIKGFVYFEYLKDQINQVWVNGNVSPNGENSTNVSTLNQQIYTRYNWSVKTYKAIQQFICDNETKYPDFNGNGKTTTFWL